jgi:hypothetical protein
VTRVLRLTATILTAFAAVLAVASIADAERIRCRSRDYKYASCRVSDRIVSARVVDRHSDRPCILNRTFGWRGNTLWVNDGCDADFDVELRNSFPYPNPGPWPGPGDGRPPYEHQAPSWAVGEWRSTDFVSGRTQYLTIYRNGNASWRSAFSIQGSWTGEGVRFTDGTYVRIRREGSRRRLRADHPSLGRIEFRER